MTISHWKFHLQLFCKGLLCGTNLSNSSITHLYPIVLLQLCYTKLCTPLRVALTYGIRIILLYGPTVGLTVPYGSLVRTCYTVSCTKDTIPFQSCCNLFRIKLYTVQPQVHPCVLWVRLFSPGIKSTGTDQYATMLYSIIYNPLNSSSKHIHRIESCCTSPVHIPIVYTQPLFPAMGHCYTAPLVLSPVVSARYIYTVCTLYTVHCTGPLGAAHEAVPLLRLCGGDQGQGFHQPHPIRGQHTLL